MDGSTFDVNVGTNVGNVNGVMEAVNVGTDVESIVGKNVGIFFGMLMIFAMDLLMEIILG